MKLYLAEIENDPYEPLRTIGIYSTKEKAHEAIQRTVAEDGWREQMYGYEERISEWELDKVYGQ